MSDALDQAKVEARRFIESRFTLRQDGTAFSYDDPGPAPGFGDTYVISYWQLDGLRWEVLEETLTRADELNGVTWKGAISVKFAAHRTSAEKKGTDPFKPKPCWHRWEDTPKGKDNTPNDMKWPFQLINGVWKISSEKSSHWQPWAIGGERAKAPNEQEILHALNFALC